MKNTNKINSQQDCDRKEDLVTYLYDEASAAERISFEQHLSECEPCGAELKTFGRVRDQLSTWQVGLAPRTELVLPRGKMDVLRELISLFPVWARGLALSGIAAAAVLLVLAFWDRNATGGVKPGPDSQNVAMSQQQIESLVKNAVAEERAKIEQQYQAQFASFKEQLDREHRARLQAVSAEHQARLDVVKANLKEEIKKSNQQRGSIRSFFAMDDYQQEPWGEGK